MRMCLIAGIVILLVVIIVPSGKLSSPRRSVTYDWRRYSCCYQALNWMTKAHNLIRMQWNEWPGTGGRWDLKWTKSLLTALAGYSSWAWKAGNRLALRSSFYFRFLRLVCFLREIWASDPAERVPLTIDSIWMIVRMHALEQVLCKIWDGGVTNNRGCLRGEIIGFCYVWIRFCKCDMLLCVLGFKIACQWHLYVW